MASLVTRRQFVVRLAAAAPAMTLFQPGVAQSAQDRISRTAEAIHQEVALSATARRVYEALTEAAQFTKVTTFSTVANAPPARIGRAAGEAFSLFGGHIVGRHLELVAPQRIVQAWRAADWEAGAYSIAKFTLRDEGGQTTIVFDHTGFPAGQAEHLAQGWYANYWEPLRRYFA
jgi:activator of HSP90 ATPase